MHASEEPVKSSPKLYLLDGSGYIYRAYYGIRDLATSGGMPTNAVFGFTRMLLGLLQENRPDYLAVVFDRPREETFRREIYPEYKANRDAMPEDLAPRSPTSGRSCRPSTSPPWRLPDSRRTTSSPPWPAVMPPKGSR